MIISEQGLYLILVRICFSDCLMIASNNIIDNLYLKEDLSSLQICFTSSRIIYIIIHMIYKTSDTLDKKAMHSMAEILDWIKSRGDSLSVSVDHISLDKCTPWYYDEEEGCIRDKNRNFFQIYGLHQYRGNDLLTEQPVIVQDEIGFLGIIACKTDDVWHYLMQAKIEPGNVNVVQISPTLQATRSNFTGKHGGRIPEYLELFLHADPSDIIVDQIQSEQSSRFLKKRNRNVIIQTGELLPESDSHKWMTLRQIKELLRYDNLVNMDTRTVLSCMPYVLMGEDADVPFDDKSYFYKTAGSLDHQTIAELYHEINDIKMLGDYRSELVPLRSLNTWEMKGQELVSKNEYPFRVIFCDISIEGREVTRWKQPLFASNGRAVFGLICCDDNGTLKFLVKARPEPGCFDTVEIGPTIQSEWSSRGYETKDEIESFFFRRLEKGDVLIDRILSEEGGRFYQEENRNVIMKIEKEETGLLPPGYVWSDYGTLNILTQINNCLNIQLRNLLTLLEF